MHEERLGFLLVLLLGLLHGCGIYVTYSRNYSVELKIFLYVRSTTLSDIQEDLAARRFSESQRSSSPVSSIQASESFRNVPTDPKTFRSMVLRGNEGTRDPFRTQASSKKFETQISGQPHDTSFKSSPGLQAAFADLDPHDRQPVSQLAPTRPHHKGMHKGVMDEADISGYETT
ncbi:hypothetical protein IE077_004470 [Cardiosporidium cionae]|uniref:Uncharacterized protein n=1 Tax=Cardiosporidium cionae TaxID=476202 RepID=A0ABQ7JFG2_9APIC|nr:hypothetical protein IE077_004470 [Cardiosporidium cionae]|eukprot:KAF8822701.1 hypothetical protein IE077_004470 [Cardiosporidium cionae]